MIAVTLLLEIDPAKIDSFISVMAVNAAASREEAGCQRFELARDGERANWFAISEIYDDAAALQAHYDSAHFAEWRRQNAEHNFIIQKLTVRGPVVA